jgi:hypothetical protein
VPHQNHSNRKESKKGRHELLQQETNTKGSGSRSQARSTQRSSGKLSSLLELFFVFIVSKEAKLTRQKQILPFFLPLELISSDYNNK